MNFVPQVLHTFCNVSLYLQSTQVPGRPPSNFWPPFWYIPHFAVCTFLQILDATVTAATHVNRRSLHRVLHPTLLAILQYPSCQLELEGVRSE